MIKLEFIQKALRTEVLGARQEGFSSVATDSRTVTDGALFIALAGPTFNGHDFIAAAMDRGALGAVIERQYIERVKVMLGRRLQKFTIVPVQDSLKAMGDLAAAHRRANVVKIAGVTGSNGKTTTKEMIASILGRLGGVVKTAGNFNNLIGLPLTVFKIGPEHRYAVLEMGMNQPGEIARLAYIALPDVALVTNVHPAHLEGLGTVETIADEKCRIFDGLPDSGTAVINMEDPLIAARAGSLNRRRLTFGRTSGCDVRIAGTRPMGLEGQAVMLEISGVKAEAVIPHLGFHNAINAAAAAATATALGATPDQICEGIADVQIVQNRLEHEEIGGIHILNDAYNANPKSMETAIETLVSMAGGRKTFTVLGDMLELGPRSSELHAELGMAAAKNKINMLIVLGSEAAATVRGAVSGGMDPSNCFMAVDAADAAWILRKRARPGDWVLVKGSRGMKMEMVIEQFRQAFAGGAG